MEKGRLREQLRTTDESLLFLGLLLLSIWLSYRGVELQRAELCKTIQGEPADASAQQAVFSVRWCASALVVGSLGYFLCLAVRTCREAEPGAAEESARTNLWTSLLVFLAALLRLGQLVKRHPASGFPDAGCRRLILREFCSGQTFLWRKRCRYRWPPACLPRR